MLIPLWPASKWFCRLPFGCQQNTAGTLQVLTVGAMSEPEKKRHVKMDLTGCVRKGGMRKAYRVGQRTFPSETARRLLAMLALDSGNPRALLNMTGGVIGHVDSVVPKWDHLSDSDSSTVEAAAEVKCNSEGGGSGRREMATSNINKKKKKRKKSMNACSIPSKPQMARTFSKCLPKQDVDEFERLFIKYQGLASCPPGCDNREIDPNALIVKTRVVTILWALQQLYGCKNVVCESTNEICGERVDGKVVEKFDYLEIVAMDAVLARTLNPPRAITGTETVDTPVRFLAQNKESLEAKCDPMFRAFVVVVPDGATYYSHRERRRACIGVANALIPMDTSWLRAKRNGTATDRFALGSYISRLWDGQPFWKFKIRRGDSNFKLRLPGKAGPTSDGLSWDPKRGINVLSAYQVSDEVGPALPPDHIDGKRRHDSWPLLRRAYRAAINQSRSSKRGCRHYAQSHLHFRIDPEKTLVIDSKDQDWDLRIATQVPRAGDDGKVDKNGRKLCRMALSRDSVVQVRNLLNLGSGGWKLVNDVWEHASSATKGKQQSARRGLGDEGAIHPVGMRVMKDKKTRSRYKTSREKGEQRALKKAIIASARLAAVTIPGILRLLQDVEEDGDIAPPEGGMNGGGPCQRVSFTMDISFDLSNASHIDVNDASQGFTIWTEDEPGSTKNWYLVLPNVYGKRQPNWDGTPGGVFHGVAIKLAHGVLISWDGRVIRHGTSIMERKDESKHVYGSFFAAKSSVVAFGARMSFVRESLRRYHAKLERRRHRKGAGACGGGEVDGGRAANGDMNEADDLMATRIPRKSLLDAASCSDEKLLDDEESWSDFSYESGVAESGIVEDGGTLMESIPFVEFLESGFEGNVGHGGGLDEWNQTSNVARLPVRDDTAGRDGGRKRSRGDESWRQDLNGRRDRMDGRELYNWRESESYWRESQSNWQATSNDNSQVDRTRDGRWRSAPVDNYDRHSGVSHVRGQNNLRSGDYREERVRDYRMEPARRNGDLTDEWDEETNSWRKYFRR